jgi:hypothetical protein
MTNLADRRNSLKSEIQSRQQKTKPSRLCFIEFKFRPTFYNFQEKQRRKTAV